MQVSGIKWNMGKQYNTGYRYEYWKRIQFLKNSIRFQTLTAIKKRIINNLFNYSGGAGQAREKPGRVGVMLDTR